MLQIPCKQERKQNSNSGNMCELHLKKAVKKKEHVGICCLALLGNSGIPSMRRRAQASPLDDDIPTTTAYPSDT